MINNNTRVAELTVEDLRALIRSILQDELQGRTEKRPPSQAELLQLPPLHVGHWPQGLELLSREEYYDDER